MSARFEPITGRYMHLDLFGRPHRIYVEEAGEGTPLLCLHTAGSDGRQYRGLMNDETNRVVSARASSWCDMTCANWATCSSSSGPIPKWKSAWSGPSISAER